MKRISTLIPAAAALAVVLCGTLQAGYILNVNQVGNDVVATGSGTLNLTALTLGSPAFAGTYVWPSLPFGSVIAVGPPSTDFVNFYGPPLGPSSFGSGTRIFADTGSGDKVGLIANDGIYLVPGYVSGSPLASTSTWFNNTIAGLGMTPGTYTFNWGTNNTADSFVINIGTPAPSGNTPEPLTGALLGAGVAGLFCCHRHRRRPVSSANGCQS